MSNSTTGISSRRWTEEDFVRPAGFAIIALCLAIWLSNWGVEKYEEVTSGVDTRQATWHLTIHEMDGTVLQKGIQARYSESPVPMLAFYESATGNNWLDNVQPTTGFDTGEGVRDGWIAKWCSDLSGGGVFITEDGSSVRWIYVWRDKKLGGGGILRKWKLVRR